MHALTTLAKLNREAEEAAHLLNARAPAAPIPAIVPENHAEIRSLRITQAAEARERILNGAKG